MLMLKKIRKENEMSARELGERVGITGKHVFDIESGRREGSLRILKLIAKELNCSLDEIVKEVNE